MGLKEAPPPEHRVCSPGGGCCGDSPGSGRRQSPHAGVAASSRLWRGEASREERPAWCSAEWWQTVLCGYDTFCSLQPKQSNCCRKMWSHRLEGLYEPGEGHPCWPRCQWSPGTAIQWLVVLNGKWLFFVSTLHLSGMLTWQIHTHTCCFTMPFPPKLRLVQVAFGSLTEKKNERASLFGLLL